MSPVLGFGDDKSAEADICWSWIESHTWDGWRLEIVTAEPHPDMAPVDPEETKLHPWEPEQSRQADHVGFESVENLRAEVDPRLALITRPWDLLAIGPRGSGVLKGMHLGSTADWLLREPTSPLVIARRPRAVATALFAADGSVHAKRALDTLIELPWARGLKVRVVTVDDGHTDSDVAQDEAIAALSAVGADVGGKVLKGNPKRQILEEIAGTDPDMVVMGARGIKGMRRLVVGSTTAAVAHSTDSTLLVAHAKGEQEQVS